MASHHPIRKHVAPESPVIPDKLYFRIGDVARLCSVPAYVLRFWETEFPQLKPNKGGTGQRLYRKRDVEMALRIKSLLYDQGYTIAGARQVFKSDAAAKEPSDATLAPAPAIAPQPLSDRSVEATDIGAAIRQDAQHRDHLASLRDELRSLAILLSDPASSPASPAAVTASAGTSAPLSGKLKAMRPRLVLDPRLEARPGSRSEPLPLNQGDLFPSE